MAHKRHRSRGVNQRSRHASSTIAVAKEHSSIPVSEPTSTAAAADEHHIRQFEDLEWEDDQEPSSLFSFSSVIRHERSLDYQRRMELVSLQLWSESPPSQRPDDTVAAQLDPPLLIVQPQKQWKRPTLSHSSLRHDSGKPMPLAVKFSMFSLLLVISIFSLKALHNEFFVSDLSATHSTAAFTLSSSSSSSLSPLSDSLTLLPHATDLVDFSIPRFAFVTGTRWGAFHAARSYLALSKSSSHSDSNAITLSSSSSSSSQFIPQLHEVFDFDATSIDNTTALISSASTVKICPAPHYFPKVPTFDQYLTQGGFLLPALGLAYALAALGLLQLRYLDPWARWVAYTRGYGSRQGEAMLLNLVGIMPQFSMHTFGLLFTNRDIGLGTVIGSTATNLFLFTLAIVWWLSKLRPRITFTLGWYRAARDSFAFCVGMLLMVSVTISGSDISYFAVIPIIAGLIGYILLYRKSWEIYQWAARGVNRATVVLNSTDPELNQYQGLIAFLEGNVFSVIINLIICFSVVCVIWDETAGPSWLVSVNYAFSAIFILEWVVKHFAYGVFGYWKEPLNAFDGVLVVLIVFEFIFSSSNIASSVRVVRLFRFLRALRGMRAIRVTRGISFRNGTFHFAKQSSRKSKSEAELARIQALQAAGGLGLQSVNALSLNAAVSEHGAPEDKVFVAAHEEDTDAVTTFTTGTTQEDENTTTAVPGDATIAATTPVQRASTASRRRASMTDMKTSKEEAVHRQKSISRSRRASLLAEYGSSGASTDEGNQSSPRHHSQNPKRSSERRSSKMGASLITGSGNDGGGGSHGHHHHGHHHHHHGHHHHHQKPRHSHTFTAMHSAAPQPSPSSNNVDSPSNSSVSNLNSITDSPRQLGSFPSSPASTNTAMAIPAPQSSNNNSGGVTITSSSNTSDGQTPRRRSSIARSMTQYQGGRHKRSQSEKDVIAEEPEGVSFAANNDSSPQRSPPQEEFRPFEPVTPVFVAHTFNTPVRHAPTPLSPILQSPVVHSHTLERDYPDPQRSPSLGESTLNLSRSQSPMVPIIADADIATGIVSANNVPPRKPSLLIRTSTFTPMSSRIHNYASNSQMPSPVINTPVSVFQPIIDAAADEAKQQPQPSPQQISSANNNNTSGSPLFVAAPPASGANVQRIPSLRIGASFMVNSSTPLNNPQQSPSTTLPQSQPVFVAAPPPKGPVLRIPGRGVIGGGAGSAHPSPIVTIRDSPKFAAIQSSSEDELTPGGGGGSSKEPGTPTSQNSRGTPRSSRLHSRRLAADSPPPPEGLGMTLAAANLNVSNKLKITLAQRSRDFTAEGQVVSPTSPGNGNNHNNPTPSPGAPAAIVSPTTQAVATVAVPAASAAAPTSPVRATTAPTTELPKKKLLVVRTPRGPGAATFKTAAEIVAEMDAADRVKAQKSSQILQDLQQSEGNASSQKPDSKKLEPGSRLLLQNRLHHVEDEQAAAQQAQTQAQHARGPSLPSATLTDSEMTVQMTAIPASAPHHAATPSLQSVWSEESVVSIHHVPHHSIANFDMLHATSPSIETNSNSATTNGAVEHGRVHQLRQANSSAAPATSAAAASTVTTPQASKRVAPTPIGGMRSNSFYMQSLGLMSPSNTSTVAPNSATVTTTTTTTTADQAKAVAIANFNRTNRRSTLTRSTTFTPTAKGGFKGSLQKASKLLGESEDTTRTFVAAASVKKDLKSSTTDEKFQEGVAQIDPRLIAITAMNSPPKRVATAFQTPRGGAATAATTEDSTLSRNSSDDDDDSRNVSRQGTFQRNGTNLTFVPIGGGAAPSGGGGHMHQGALFRRNQSMGPRLQTITSTALERGGDSGRNSPHSAGEHHSQGGGAKSREASASREYSESEYSSDASYSYTYSYSFGSDMNSESAWDSGSSSSSSNDSNSASSQSEASLDSHGEKKRRPRRRKIRAWSVVPKHLFHWRARIASLVLSIMIIIVLAALALQIYSLIVPTSDGSTSTDGSDGSGTTTDGGSSNVFSSTGISSVSR